jgi:hypothetical protein
VNTNGVAASGITRGKALFSVKFYWQKHFENCKLKIAGAKAPGCPQFILLTNFFKYYIIMDAYFGVIFIIFAYKKPLDHKSLPTTRGSAAD